MPIHHRGMLLLDKPEGLTSFQALGACKRLFGTRKVGHAGTLDKFASGLLLVFVNEATRLVPWFVGLDKTYRAGVRFGEQTDTLDPEGTVVAQVAVPSAARVLAALPSFLGPQSQVPPAYSAIHIDGKRAYERVLAGEDPEMKPREICIDRLAPGEFRGADFDLELDCSSGTYVRALARDLGLRAGSVAHLHALRRSRVGAFRVEDAISQTLIQGDGKLDQASSAWCAGSRLAAAIPGVSALELRPEHQADFRNGKLVKPQWFSADAALPEPGQECAVSCGDDFLGILKRLEAGWEYRLVFPPVAFGADS